MNFSLKKTFAILLCAVCTQSAFAQSLVYPGSDDRYASSFHLGLAVGAGLANVNNYDVGPCAQLELTFPVRHAIDFGFFLQYQEYSLYYQNLSPYAAFNETYSGVTIRNRSDYAFFTPEINVPLGGLRFPRMINFYVDGGVGFNVSGSETLHKWNNTNSLPLYTVANYDSTISTTKDINKMIYKYGFGFTENTYLYHRRMYLTFTEDFSFTAGSISTTSNVNGPNHTPDFPTTLSPVYFSFKVGFTFCHRKRSNSYYRDARTNDR
jgi:hypothetical protein